MWLWAGIVVGISFVEAPTKFTAPSLTLPVALDVGRVVFAMSHRVQLGLLVITLACSWAGRGALRRRTQGLLVGAAVIFLLQVAGVQPPLDARTARIIAGETLEPSHLHRVYVVLDLAKLGLLSTLGWILTRGARPRSAKRATSAEVARNMRSRC